MNLKDETLSWIPKFFEFSIGKVYQWASEADKRKNYFKHNQEELWNSIVSSMLIGCFAYVEGQLGNRWWLNLNSHNTKRAFIVLWYVRNAFTHNGGLLKVSKYFSTRKKRYVKHYLSDLGKKKIQDKNGNVLPIYIRLDGDKVIFEKEAPKLIRIHFEAAFRFFK